MKTLTTQIGNVNPKNKMSVQKRAVFKKGFELSESVYISIESNGKTFAEIDAHAKKVAKQYALENKTKFVKFMF